MKITLLLDNENSWLVPFANTLESKLKDLGHEVERVSDQKDMGNGDVAFLLACEKMVSSETRAKNKHNLVIHESAVPAGKGMSPLTWQILEGKNDIPITLLEAEDKVDSGDVYMQETMHFEGHELVDELRSLQGEKTIELALAFVNAYPEVTAKEQEGEESVYQRRGPKDSELDIEKSIKDQFDLLRTVDNERYPAHFTHRGHKYILKIFKDSGN